MSQSSYTKLTHDIWMNSNPMGHEFEVESVMTYCSLCSAVANNRPVLTIKVTLNLTYPQRPFYWSQPLVNVTRKLLQPCVNDDQLLIPSLDNKGQLLT